MATSIVITLTVPSTPTQGAASDILQDVVAVAGFKQAVARAVSPTGQVQPEQVQVSSVTFS